MELPGVSGQIMNQEKARIYLLNKKVLFPHSAQAVILRNTVASSELKTGDKIITYPLRNILDIFLIKRRISTLAEITEVSINEKQIKLQIKGLARIRITGIKGFREASYEPVHYAPVKNEGAMTKELRVKAQELIFLINVDESDRLIALMNFLVDLNQICDFIANYFILDNRIRIILLNQTDITTRCENLIDTIDALIDKFRSRGENQ